jgi:hypothetical protein
MQIIGFPLRSLTYAAGGNDVVTLRDLPKTYQGRLPHLIGIAFDVDYTPTYTTAPTVYGANNIVKQCDFWDGNMFRFQGGFNHMRFKDRLEACGTKIADQDLDTASATVRTHKRFLAVGPTNFANWMTDFGIPTGMLENGELRIQYGALTDVSADTTVLTATIRPVAICILRDEIGIPPAYQFINQSVTAADINISGRALYDKLALLDSATAYGAITAGDFSNVRVDLGSGDVVPGVDASTLDLVMQYLYEAGDFAAFKGEPRNAQDDATKVANRSSPTAIVGQTADLSPILFTLRDAKISKLALAESVARIRWTGTQSTGGLLISRILSQPPSVVLAQAGKALGKLGVNAKDMRIKTLSKKDYTGPYKEFMPWVAKV